MRAFFRAPVKLGSRLPVTVPFARCNKPQPADKGRLELGRIRVLLADDHEAMLNRVADLLKALPNGAFGRDETVGYGEPLSGARTHKARLVNVSPVTLRYAGICPAPRHL